MVHSSIADALQRATAAEASYRCRRGPTGAEISWRLTADALVREGTPARGIPYRDIRRIRLFGAPGMTYAGSEVAPASAICHIKLKAGRAVTLSSNHMHGWGRFEDRWASFQPFVDRLVQHAVRANPGVIVVSGMPFGLWALWAFVLVASLAFTFIAAAVGIGAVVQVGSALWSGDHHALRFDALVDGGFALPAAVIVGAGIPILVRTLRHEWPRRITWRRSHD